MKKLFLIPFMAILLVACGDSAEEKRLKEARENAYIDSSNGNSITDIEPTGDVLAEYIADLEGYDYDKKSGYSVNYMRNGERCLFNVYSYKNNNKVIFFWFEDTCDRINGDNLEVLFYKRCEVEVTENAMIAVKGIIDSEECNNKEGEAYNKILNAINHETYFDY